MPALAEAGEAGGGARGIVARPFALEVVVSVRLAQVVGLQRAGFSARRLDFSS
jgi:hypothetical protein